VWLNIRGETLPPGVPPPDATISTIGEVPKLLSQAAVL
jgi:hypothetical protein